MVSNVDDDKLPAPVMLLLVLVFLAFFAVCAWFCTAMMARWFGDLIYITHGEHVQAQITERQERSNGIVYVRLAYAIHTSSGDETTISHPNWMELPPEDKAASDVVSIVVHPNNSHEVKFKNEAILLFIIGTFFVVATLGFVVFYIVLGFWMLSGLDWPARIGRHAKVFAFAALACSHIGILVYFLVTACSHRREYYAQLQGEEQSTDGTYEDFEDNSALRSKVQE